MKSHKRFRVGTLAILCGALVLGAAAGLARERVADALASVSGRPEVKVTLAGTVTREGQALALADAGLVHPGEVLQWNITSENNGTGAARSYKAVGQIPRGTLLVIGSTVADGAADVTYSIDGGRNYSAQPTVEERQADGSVRPVPAPIASYTHVRYEWQDALAAGSTLNASYKVRVR